MARIVLPDHEGGLVSIETAAITGIGITGAGQLFVDAGSRVYVSMPRDPENEAEERSWRARDKKLGDLANFIDGKTEYTKPGDMGTGKSKT